MFVTLRQAIDLIGREHRSRWGLLILLALGVSALEMLGATLVYVLVGLVSNPGGEVDLPLIGDIRNWAGDLSDRTLLIRLIVVMAIFFVLRSVVQVGSVYIQKRVAENAGARLSNQLVAGYLRWPYEAHLHRSSSEFIRNGHQGVQQLVEQVFVPMIRVSAELFLTIGMLVLMFAIAPVAALGAILMVGGAGTVLLLVVQPRLKRLGRSAHAMQRETLASLQQSLRGIRDLKVLGRERHFADVYARSRLGLARTAYLRDTLYEIPRTTVELSLIGFILLLFAVIVGSGASAEATLPVLGLFAYSGLRLQPSVQRTIAGLNSIRFSAAPLGDVHTDLNEIQKLPSDAPVARLPFDETILLENVSFRYRGAERDALSEVNLTIRSGEQIGICGPTGGGKTTLVDLITGLLEPTSGSIRVDGQDLRDHVRAWQRNLGAVSQTVFLMDDTLARNVTLGIPDDQVNNDALVEAIELAQLTGFVESLPQGLETMVGELGVRLSGGERQRIAIARALYHRPAVLTFDEGTSALDNVTESQLMASIEQLRGEHTVILIAHRLSTVRHSDRVVFVDQGRIAGQGTFESLVVENDRFRALADVP